MCKECFFYAFESEIHNTITQGKLFKPSDKVAIGASGGKDSTVLAYVLKTLNERYQYGIDLFLLSIDEGITGIIIKYYPIFKHSRTFLSNFFITRLYYFRIQR